MTQANDIPEVDARGKFLRTLGRPLDAASVLIERKHVLQEAFREIDTFGRFWTLAFRISPEPIGFARLGKIEFNPRLNAVFTPPFSIVDWNLKPGTCEWKSILSRTPLPVGLPTEPVAFEWNGAIPNSTNEALEIVRSARDHVPVGKIEIRHPMAVKTKRFIDQNFTESMSIEEMAAALKTSHAAMSRTFRSAYGIPPLAYRNRLRVFEALLELIENQRNVTDSSNAMGFEEFSTFYRQFTNVFGLAPSQYVPSRTPNS